MFHGRARVPMVVMALTALSLVYVGAAADRTSRPAVQNVPAADVDVFPTAATTGVPPGWQPVDTIDGDYEVNKAGAVVEDLRINGALIVNAPNVTVRRVEIIGGYIDNFRDSTCHNGLVIESSTIRRGSSTDTGDRSAIGTGGYTASGVLIDGVTEGFRVSGVGDCGPVQISETYARVVSPDTCGDWHGDALQGYLGDRLTIRNTVLILEERSDCGGTAPFFYPADQGNTSVDIDGLIVVGGSYSFRLGTPGSVQRLNIVSGSWEFGPIDVECSLLSSWQAWIVTLNSTGQPVPIRSQPCDSESPS